MQCINCTTTLYYRWPSDLVPVEFNEALYHFLSATPCCSRVLHTVLLQQSKDEFDKLDDEAVHSIVANTPFQIALLACIAELASFAASGRACFPALTARANAMGCIFDMWEVLLYVQHHLLKVRQVCEKGPEISQKATVNASSYAHNQSHIIAADIWEIRSET